MANVELGKQAARALADRGVSQSRPCSQCGSTEGWQTWPWYLYVDIADDQSPTIPGESLRCIGTSCNQCGFLGLHQAGMFGL